VSCRVAWTAGRIVSRARIKSIFLGAAWPRGGWSSGGQLSRYSSYSTARPFERRAREKHADHLFQNSLPQELSTIPIRPSTRPSLFHHWPTIHSFLPVLVAPSSLPSNKPSFARFTSAQTFRLLLLLRSIVRSREPTCAAAVRATAERADHSVKIQGLHLPFAAHGP
jgi:hypothetical protein